jgi:transcriptional regulator with XRE-family HTH domain
VGTANHIRNYRIRAGKSAGEVARQLGVNDAWYHDLEQRDDELSSTLTLFQAIELASLLGVRLHDLVGEEVSPGEAIPLTDLPSRIETHLASNRMTIDQLEEQVGSDLREFLQSPVKVAAESPIIFLQALAEQLDMNWLSFVPDEVVP